MKEDVHRRADITEGIERFRYPYKDVRMKEDVHRRADITEGIERFRYPYKDVDQAVPEWDCLYLCNKRDDIDYTTMYRAPLKEWEEEHHE